MSGTTTVLNYIEWADRVDFALDAIGASKAWDAFEKACEDFSKNPSAEERKAVDDAFNDFMIAGGDLAPGYPFAPGGAFVEGGIAVYSPSQYSDEMLMAIGQLGKMQRRVCNAYMDPQAGVDYTSSRNFTRRDPLVLDLDGDGIETVGTGGIATVQFDHDGDGTKTGTGWVKGDDALLALDRDGNGTIDSGAELFGVDTVKSDGSKAVDGFDALRDLDSNGDGVFDANDAQFGNVRVWRDLNQDGFSDAGELQSLSEAGIASINLDASVSTTNFGNGNVQTASSTFTRTDGTTSKIANVDLADNPFYRTYTDSVVLTEQAKALPGMQGSGAVRDLREAASLSGDLVTALTGYAAQTTRAGQQAQLDSLLHAWADSPSIQTIECKVVVNEIFERVA